MDLPLPSLQACIDFIQSQPASVIASRLLHDREICRSGSNNNGAAPIPSLLAYCLPPRADHIARALSSLDAPDIPLALARMRYTEIIASIKNYLSNLSLPTNDDHPIPTHMVPTDVEYHAAIKVLQYLQLPQVQIKLKGIDAIVATIQSQIALAPPVRTSVFLSSPTSTSRPTRKRTCYICRFRFSRQQHHRLYPSLCHTCGEFNIASSALTLPPNLNLHGKTAVVTGGRVNLGYHTALRLLRCGARVIVSTRYPRDAQDRYLAEPDVAHWQNNLRIAGADFRTAKDVFALVQDITQCLEEWDVSKLDILINNAAQTLTDPIEKEEQNIQHEFLLTSAPPTSAGSSSVFRTSISSYVPRVRGGNQPDRLLTGTTLDITSSSWTQTITEIPYEDVISAHSVNTFVPFILIRELLPLLSSARQAPQGEGREPRGSKPASYIVNVSSREGIAERRAGGKDGFHVHTNMSKAALNMLTETEASRAWREGRVAMNAVDPGFMSADPTEKPRGRQGSRKWEDTPLGWEDGVARVLWVVAKCENENVAIWGKFLKHFVEIDPTR
ncbi:hypothetical protein AMATHDRAFT_77100 [Amanita thiersii Skay4041]|uniref:Uncharacterized protein n=1 Tax=Amanita thiersii Skay4041 TaxID=703135 RepID=A0A2A9NIX3_9AGAR|nr:hypothetical protein AMATHDRAFT_77100 [Amanita thiersii Skay4041]